MLPAFAFAATTHWIAFVDSKAINDAIRGAQRATEDIILRNLMVAND